MDVPLLGFVSLTELSFLIHGFIKDFPVLPLKVSHNLSIYLLNLWICLYLVNKVWIDRFRPLNGVIILNRKQISRFRRMKVDELFPSP